MTARAFDMERELCEIANGQRMAADVREREADARMLAGDETGAERLRDTARHLRAGADETVRGLAKLYRARVAAPEYVETSTLISALATADVEAQRARERGAARQREHRVVALRARAT